jgi:hypothetical protein
LELKINVDLFIMAPILQELKRAVLREVPEFTLSDSGNLNKELHSHVFEGICISNTLQPS